MLKLNSEHDSKCKQVTPTVHVSLALAVQNVCYEHVVRPTFICLWGRWIVITPCIKKWKSCDPKFYTRRPAGLCETVEFCIVVAMISVSNGLHVTLSQHLLSFLLTLLELWRMIAESEMTCNDRIGWGHGRNYSFHNTWHKQHDKK